MNKEPVLIPAAITGVVQATLNLLVVFGVALSSVQLGAINTFIGAIYIGVAFYSRSQVTPVAPPKH